jgi:hypothetical protein
MARATYFLLAAIWWRATESVWLVMIPPAFHFVVDLAGEAVIVGPTVRKSCHFL